MLCRLDCILTVVLHVLSEKPTSEFDPFYLERMKQTLTLMLEKSVNLYKALELDFALNTFTNAAEGGSAPPTGPFSSHREEVKEGVL